MAMHLAKQRRMRMEGVDNGFAEANPISAVAARGKRSTSFDPARYLQVRGWAGHGAALDGHGGRGLRKPILIPHKRDNKGLGQNRDRAVEWWDCLFETRAKALASGSSSAPTSQDSSGASTPTTNTASKMSLQTLAKREQARRQLMSNFLRGATIQMGPSPEDLKNERVAAEEHTQRAQVAAEADSSKDKDTGKDGNEAKTDKIKRKEARRAEKASVKEARKEDKKRKRSDKAKETRRLEKEAKRAAKVQKRVIKTARQAARPSRPQNS